MSETEKTAAKGNAKVLAAIMQTMSARPARKGFKLWATLPLWNRLMADKQRKESKLPINDYLCGVLEDGLTYRANKP